MSFSHLLALLFVLAGPLASPAFGGQLGLIDLRTSEEDPISTGSLVRITGLTTNLSGTESELGTYLLAGEFQIDGVDVTEEGGVAEALVLAEAGDEITATTSMSGNEFVASGELILYDDQGIVKAIRFGQFTLVSTEAIQAVPEE